VPAVAPLALDYSKGGLRMSSKDLKPKRKTHTSSEVKARYNAKTYDRIQINLRKDKAAAYKAKCDELGISYSWLIHKAIDDFLAE